MNSFNRYVDSLSGELEAILSSPVEPTGAPFFSDLRAELEERGDFDGLDMPGEDEVL